MYRYERRENTVYRIEANGRISVMFHLASFSTSEQIRNADTLVKETNASIIDRTGID